MKIVCVYIERQAHYAYCYLIDLTWDQNKEKKIDFDGRRVLQISIVIAGVTDRNYRKNKIPSQHLLLLCYCCIGLYFLPFIVLCLHEFSDFCDFSPIFLLHNNGIHKESTAKFLYIHCLHLVFSLYLMRKGGRYHFADYVDRLRPRILSLTT